VLCCAVLCCVSVRYHIVSIPDDTRPPRPTRDASTDVSAATRPDLWASDLLVGFNKPHLAAKFRQEALARHFWDRPVSKKVPSQQQQQQQTQTQGSCDADGGVCEASASAAAAGAAGSSSSSIPRTVTVLWYPEDYPPVTNHRELVQMLEELSEPYGFKVSLQCPAPAVSLPPVSEP
jgi:hypothetical protein